MTPYQSVVFFDLDGTLMINPFESAVWPAVVGEIAEKSGESFDIVLQQIIAENESRQNNAAVPAVLSMDWDDITQTVASKYGVRLETSCESVVCEFAASHSSILDNARDVLAELTASHRALVVATKGLAKYQQPVLDALGLMPFFTAIITPDSYRALKKQAAFFGTWPSETRLQIMVGDRYDDDVQGPSSHGFKTIWKRPDLSPVFQKKDPFARALMYDYAPKQTTPADAIIYSLAELPPLIRRLEQAVLGFSD